MTHVFHRQARTMPPVAVHGDGVHIIDSSGKRAANVAFSSTCGTRCMAAPARSDSVRPDSTMIASTWSAATMPSPVVACSRNTRWPDCSPPKR